mmetsp:Transcript_76528/g.127561  ORF Transcript_76528/g.127561 Transcript_76528/m.127561 type:complete len:229 (+) Transcript_76528:371-1057(+)
MSTASAARRSVSRKVRNRPSVFQQRLYMHSKAFTAKFVASLLRDRMASLSLKRRMRDVRFGVPTKSLRSKRPGLVTAASMARRRLVARKKAQRRFRAKSASFVSMAVVSMRLSMPSFGSVLSKQNSSISSNSTTTRSSCMSRLNTLEMQLATLLKPSARNTLVSMVTKPQPSHLAKAATMVVLAVPGGPNRMAEWQAAASSSTRSSPGPRRPSASAASRARNGANIRV